MLVSFSSSVLPSSIAHRTSHIARTESLLGFRDPFDPSVLSQPVPPAHHPCSRFLTHGRCLTARTRPSPLSPPLKMWLVNYSSCLPFLLLPPAPLPRLLHVPSAPISSPFVSMLSPMSPGDPHSMSLYIPRHLPISLLPI